MHARLRRCCGVCDNTAAVMLGVGKGIYACSRNQSRAGVVPSSNSFVLARGLCTARSSACVSPNARNGLWMMTEITPGTHIAHSWPLHRKQQNEREPANTNPPIVCCWFICLFIHSLTHSLTHSFIHSFIHLFSFFEAGLN